MSPEQGTGRPVDGRTDVYSLGIILYQMLTGRVPYEADTPYAVIIAHERDPLPIPSSLNPDIPEEVEKVIFKALAKDPNARYQTAGRLAQDLQKTAAALGETPQLNASTDLLGLSAGLAERKPSDEVTRDVRLAARKKPRQGGASPLVIVMAGIVMVGVIVAVGWSLNSANSRAAAVQTTATALSVGSAITPMPSATPTETAPPTARAHQAAGVVLPTEDWKQIGTFFQDDFKAAGYDVTVLFSQNDPAKEKANVETLISQGITVLFICPQDGKNAGAAAEAARKAGIKVISYDRLIRDTEAVDYFVNFDGIAIGAQQAQYLVDHATGQGNNLYLYAGSPIDEATFDFFEGS